MIFPRFITPQGLNELAERFVVRDDDELRFAHEFLQQIREAPDIRFIEGRVQLVEHAKRRWFHHVEGEEQGHSREGLLPA